MTSSKAKFKRAAKPKPSDFIIKAQRAMRKAQKTAARENARFGLRLIVQPAR